MKKIGKYEILEMLGKGAMGLVYKALDPDINREVAVKTIRFDMISDESEKEDLMKRFMREAQAAGKLVHPNIVTIFNVGKEENLTYIVMQFISGRSLKEVIDSEKKMPIRDIIRIMCHLCDALDYAHQNGIVHRDIKPANILLDQKGKPLIVDFGVAHVEMSNLTQSGTIIGTPSYMSPEQVIGKDIDRRSDIFSLGIILYELLTGKKPFEGDHITAIAYKIVNEKPKTLHEQKKNLPKDFEYILEKALAKSPKERYQSCREMADELNAMLEPTERTVILGKDGKGISVRPEKKKKKLLVVFAAFFAVIFLAAAGGYLLFPDKAKDLISLIKKTELIKKTDELYTIVTPPPARLVELPLDTSADNLSKVRESFKKEDFALTVQLAEEILSDDTNNAEAREYLDLALGKLNESVITKNLAYGISSYKNKNYQQCLRAMRKVLVIDSENKEAKTYLYRADTAISRGVILNIIAKQKDAQEGEDLLALLSYFGPVTLQKQKKSESITLFNEYDDIKSSISNVSVKFEDRNRALVTFSNLLTAVSKKTRQNTILFEGTRTWTMKQDGNIWKIIKY